MSKYKVLWIDDNWQKEDSFIDVCGLPQHDIEVIPCKYSVSGMVLFEQQLESWSAVILDAKVLMDENSKEDDLDGLQYSVNKIHELSHIRQVPYFIFTGQPDLLSNKMFTSIFGKYYEKDKDEDLLLNDIKIAADKLIETQIEHRYQAIFDFWKEQEHDLLRIYKVEEYEQWTNNSVLNDIRKIISDILFFLNRIELCCIQHDGSNLAECSRAIGDTLMTELIPIYIQRAIHTCIDVTNPGSHRTRVDNDVASGVSPYLIRSLIFEMSTILYWCTLLPTDEASIDANMIKVAEINAKIQQRKKKS